MLVVGNRAAEDQQEPQEQEDILLDNADSGDDADNLEKPGSDNANGGGEESGDDTGMSSSAMSASEADQSLRGKRRVATGEATSSHHRRQASHSRSRSRRQPSSDNGNDGGEESGDDTGMSSSAISVSEADGSQCGKRRAATGGTTSSHHRSRSSKSPSRSSLVENSAGKEAKAISKSSVSTTKVRPKGGRPSRTRSSVDEDPPSSSQEQRKSHRSSRRRSSLADNNTSSSAEQQQQQEQQQKQESEASGVAGGIKTKTSSSSREGKSYKSNSATSRSSRDKGHSAKYRGSNSKGDKISSREDAKHRRRRLSPPMISEKTLENAGSSANEALVSNITSNGEIDSNPVENLPIAIATENIVKPSSSIRSKHRSKSRSRRTTGGNNDDKKEGSTLDSTSFGPPSSSSTTDPTVSLRSSVKVASALVKFRMVLAKSKQATKAAKKYHTNQDKQANNDDLADLGSGHKENWKNGASSSRHKRDPSHHRENGTSSSSSHHEKRDASRHKRESSRHRKDARDEDGVIVRKSSKRGKDSGTSRTSTNKKEEKPAVDPGDMLMNALTNVGRKLAKEKAEKKGAAPEMKMEATKTTTPTSSSVRLKSSAKVSTAMLKFQQALALSKSATLAAKTQQNTQNMLLREFHSGSKPVATPEDYRLKYKKSAAAARTSTMANAIISPVSTVDMVESPPRKDGPKVPADLDGGSFKDLDSDDELSIDDGSKADYEDISMSGSEVELDSDDEMDSDIDSEIEIYDGNDNDDFIEVATDSESDAKDAEKGMPVIVVTPEPSVEKTQFCDRDLATSMSDHSSVVMDSDDDLDSDGEFDDDDDVKEHAADFAEVGQEELLTPLQSSWNADANPVILNQNDSGSQQEGEKPGGDKVVEISNRLQMVRSLSFTSSTSSGLDRSLSDWKPASSRDITRRAGLNLAIPGLSLLSPESSQPSLSYLPAGMKATKPTVSDECDDCVEEVSKDKRVGQDKVKRVYDSDSETNKRSSKDLTRKPSSRSLRKSSSSGEPSTTVDAGKLLPDESSLGSRRSSRVRKPPSRSRSSSAAAVKAGLVGGEQQSDRKSKTSSSSGGDISKSKERGARRGSSMSRARTLAGVSALSEATNTKSSSHTSEKRDEAKRPSSRRRPPNRAKSHDGSTVKASRPAVDNGDNNDKEARGRRRRPTKPLED